MKVDGAESKKRFLFVYYQHELSGSILVSRSQGEDDHEERKKKRQRPF